METKLLTQNQFNDVLKALKFPESLDYGYLFDVYEAVGEGIELVAKSASRIDLSNINNIIIIHYILYEYMYRISGFDQKKIAEYNDSDEEFQKIVSICVDKYLTNEKLNIKSMAFTNKFRAEISTLQLYLNLELGSLDREDMHPKNDSEKNIYDLLINALNLSNCIITLLTQGFETEAFSTWRTLHEDECILRCLKKYGKKMNDEYTKHKTYAFAYRGQINSKEETDNIFIQMKQEMRDHQLKSKDMKKFIEYGYLYTANDIDQYPNFKLNFRDGVETLADLKQYSSIYETASEIAHSSPILLSPKRDYFFELTMICLYETFFRVEEIFYSYYKTKVNKDLENKYFELRKIYLKELLKIHNGIVYSFISRNQRISDDILEAIENGKKLLAN